MNDRVWLCVAAATLMSAQAAAQDESVHYVKGSVGLAYLLESGNGGQLRAPFEAPILGATIQESAAYGFDTEFDPGVFAILAFGKESQFGPFRSEIEFSYTRNSVAEHSGFEIIGLNLDGNDAAVLLGADEPVGASVGEVLADTNGQVSTVGGFVNFIMDFPTPGRSVQPYLGAGIGGIFARVDFAPGEFEFIDRENKVVFGYQLMAGFDMKVDEENSFTAGFRYRAGQELDLDTSALVTSELKVELDQTMLELGWRRRF